VVAAPADPIYWILLPEGQLSKLRIECAIEAVRQTLRLIEVAQLLSVTKQRVHQLAAESVFEAPVAEELARKLLSAKPCSLTSGPMTTLNRVAPGLRGLVEDQVAVASGHSRMYLDFPSPA
jgi:hypothetical protein